MGYHELVGEIIRLEGDMATIQVNSVIILMSGGILDLFDNRCMRRHLE